MTPGGSRLYRALLLLLPRTLRRRFGEDIVRLHRDMLRSEPVRRGRTRVWVQSVTDIAVAAVAGRKDVLAGVSPAPAAGGPPVTVTKVPPALRKPLTHDEVSISRRQFLNRAWTLSCMGVLGFLGMSSLSFLWPKLSGGFGTKIKVGNYSDLLAQVGPQAGFKPLFVPQGRFWLTYYDGDGTDPVYLATGAMETKLQALYRKCVHLGCSVPICTTSMLFECPCHGSKYRLTGEYYLGPAPRGLDRFPLEVVEGEVIVDTGSLQQGPPRGADTWSRFSQPIGPLCQPRP